MVSQILAAIAAIPQLLNAIRELLAYFKKADEEKWFAKQNEIFHKDIPAMQTTEEFQETAGKIQDQLKKL